jgi:anti-sigma B factor antagonist
VELEFEVTSADLGNGTFVVSVSGEADIQTAPQIERELQGVLRLGARSVAVDLGQVGFIDSTALGLFFRFQPRFRARGGDLVIVSEDRRVLRTLEITGLDRILRVEQRLGEAVGDLFADGRRADAAPTPKPA